MKKDYKVETKPDKIEYSVVNEIAKNHAKIIDDFMKVYLASRWESYFSKQKKIDLSRLELVERIESATKRVYFFRLKRGKSRNKIQFLDSIL